MSLVIYISQKTVIISKYGLEFGFVPPSPNLTKAAIGAYLLLRQSEILQTGSTRSEKEEAITLLKRYGLALFQAIIPDHSKSQVYKAGGVFIYALEKEIIDLPWELLHDGSSFFALTQGVIRINQSETDLVPAVAQFSFPALRLSLNSHYPLQQHTNARFIAHMEELAVRVVPRSPLIELQVNGNASRKSIAETLDRSPNIFFFSGFDSEDGWLLQEPLQEQKQAGSLDIALRPHLMQAVKDGLKIVVLQTSYLLEQPKNSYRNLLRFFFDCGVSYIVAIHGRLAQSRLNEYFNIFLLGLIREENISRAHRLAINHIQASLPLSWDWSWIRFHINQKLLENASEHLLPPFHFIRKHEDQAIPPVPLYHYKDYLPNRLFPGDPADLERFITEFATIDRHTIICLNAANGQPVEALLSEWVRRSISTRSIRLSALYYQRWGFGSDTDIKLHASKFAERFAFLTGESQTAIHFEQSLLKLAGGEEAEPGDNNILFVYTPPFKPDLEFDRWLSQKQHDRWRIVFICDQAYGTSLKTHVFDLGRSQPLQVINSFEDGLPDTWIGLVENNLPACMEELTLLKIIHKAENPDLILIINSTTRLEHAYQTCFQFVLSALSANRLKLLVSLYLMKVSFPKVLLEAVLEIKGIETDLNYLFDCHLIEASLSFEQFWIPIDLQQRMHQLSLIPNHTILGLGQELLQQLIAYPNDDTGSLRYLESGFHYCIMHLVQIGELEYPLQRNLQFGKKLSRKFQSEFRHGLNLLTSLELVLRIGKGHLIQKTLFSLVETLEELPYENETVAICEWLLMIEKKHRNWPLVSEIQTRLASIFAAQDKKEKAIGLISSAIKLNNDIKNFSSRYRNLISIALLLLDLEEFEKLAKLLTTANFDIALLNEEDIARLWLIDGHMLIRNGKLKEAETSFNKIVQRTDLNVSDSLMAKTFLHLAEIYHSKNDWPLYVQYLESAVKYVQAIGDDEKAAQLHEELYEQLVSQEDFLGAVSHLEWIYRYHQAIGNKILIRKAADLLGGLYFKIGEHAKSTELYSVAQGI